jgi:hypothetical protein
MRTFMSMDNLLRGMALSAAVTVMSASRIAQAGILPGIMIPASFVLMTFLCGAVTAWGTSAGMPGVVTDRRTLMNGSFIAAAISLVALPVQLFWTDPVLHAALAGSAKPSVADLAFPPTLGGRLALLLWTASFETMFLQAAPMSFFARLSGRRLLAAGLCLVFRAYVATLQVADAGMTNAVPLFLVSNVVAAAVGCTVFARFGLFPAMILGAGLSLHVFFPPADY